MHFLREGVTHIFPRAVRDVRVTRRRRLADDTSARCGRVDPVLWIDECGAPVSRGARFRFEGETVEMSIAEVATRRELDEEERPVGGVPVLETF